MKSLATENQSLIKSAWDSTHHLMTERTMDLSAFLAKELAAVDEYVRLGVLMNMMHRVMHHAMACRALC